MKVIQQRFDESLNSDGPYSTSIDSLSDLCEVSSQRQAAFSELILDIAWLIRKPGTENFQQIITTSQIQRLNYLLNFLISIESTTILEKILQNLKTVMDKMESNGSCNGINVADLRLLQKYMDYAHQLRSQKLQKTEDVWLHSSNSKSYSQNDSCSVGSFPSQVQLLI